MHPNYGTKSLNELHTSDSDSDPDWNEQLISAVRQREGKSKKISEKSRLERIEDCLNEGADINAIDKDGNTVLHTAVKKDWKLITQFLLHHGARTDIYNRHGQTARAIASIINDQEIADFLKEPYEPGRNGMAAVSNEFTSVDNPKPSTSRESMVKLSNDLSTFDNPKSDSNQHRKNLKRKSSVHDDLNKNAQKLRVPSNRFVNASSLCEKLHSDETEREITDTSFFDEKNTYAASGLKRSLHGTVYQLKHLMLILHRAWKLGYPFRLSTEMNAAEKFDDLVLQYRDKMGKEVHRFVQVKHKQKESREIRASDLLTQEDGEFSVQKYFTSWRKIRKNSEFTGSQTKSFILCTNIGIDFEGLKKAGIICKPVTEPDEFLNVTNRSEQPPRYKLFADDQSELRKTLKATSDVCKLARVLAQRVREAKDIDLKTTIFKYYHTALAREVIDIENKKFFPNFISGNNLSKKARNFRTIFFSNTKQLSKRDTSDEDIWKSVGECSLKLSTTFGKEFELTDEPELSEVHKFTQEFVRLLNTAKKDNVVNIARNKYHKQAKRGSVEKIVADNIDKLAGHVLVREGGKLKFRSQFLDDKNQSSGNVDEFRDALKTQMGDKYNGLNRFEFTINNFKTCEEEQLYSQTELPDDIIYDVEISDFLNDFILAVDQPDEIELGEMIAYEIGTDSQFNILNGDFISDSFQKLMLDWFKHKGKDGTFLSNKEAEDFFNAMELKVSSLVTIGLHLAYPETLEKYGIKYRDRNVELQRFVTSSNTTEPQILNIIASRETLFTALRIYQTLLKIQKYKKNDSFIFVHLKTLLLTGVMNRVMSAFGSAHSHHLLIIDCGSTTENENLQGLWNPLCKIVKKYSDKRMIVITQGSHHDIASYCKIGVTNLYEREEEVSFNNLTNFSQQKLLEKSVINFQGREERTSFGKLLEIQISDIDPEDSKNLEEIIDSSTLARLIRDEEIKIGKNLKGLGEIEDYYINRKIVRRVIIKEDILKSRDIPDLFAISDNHRTKDFADSVQDEKMSETDATGRQSNRITVLENGREADQFKILCEQNSECNVHWLRSESETLIWKQSLGCIGNLVKYRDEINDGADTYRTGSHGITEDQLIARNEDDRKIVIISDTAGMGKSTVLTHLASKMKETKSDLLVVSINLDEHTTVLAEEKKTPSFERDNINKAVDFLVEKFLNFETSSETSMFRRMIMKHGKAALFFDGFDEISPNYEETVINLLKAFAKLPIKKLFVTTRPHTRQTLEIKLNTFSHTMEPFSTADQVEFLTSFWKKRLNLKSYNHTIEERLKKYAEAVMKILAESIDDWTRELTGVPLQTRMVAEIFCDIEYGKQRDFYVCENFLNSKENDPKLPEKIDLIYLYSSFVDKKYHIYRTEKRKDDPTNLGVEEDSEDLREIFLKRHQKLALRTLFDKEDLRQFLPSNYQEEICVDILVSKLNKGRERTGIVTRVIDSRPYFIHRTFAEYFTAMFLFKTIKNDDRYDPARKFFVSEILLKSDYKTIRAFLNCLLSTEGEDSGNESWKSIWNEQCTNPDETSVHVAAAEGNCGIIRFFLNCFSKHPADRKTLINIRNDIDQTAAYVAATNGHWNAFRLLAQHGDVDINFSPIVGKSLLQMATATGHSDIVKYLVEKGANVNSRDNFGFTPIDEGAFSSDLDAVKNLLEKGADINSKSNSGQTPAHWAAGRRNLNVLKYLVEKGADVNCRDAFGMTPIFQACLHGELKIVKYLHEVGANVNLPDMFGFTPLQRAALSGNWNVVRYLLANGANSECLDEHSWTLLHKAST